MTAVISVFCKQRLSVQRYFNMLDRKLNDLKTHYKASRTERLELLAKINDVATNAHPDAIRYLIKENIEIEIRKQHSILNSYTVNIILV